MKFSTGPLFTRFPRSDGYAKYISSPTLSLAGFMILGIDTLLLCLYNGSDWLDIHGNILTGIRFLFSPLWV